MLFGMYLGGLLLLIVLHFTKEYSSLDIFQAPFPELYIKRRWAALSFTIIFFVIYPVLFVIDVMLWATVYYKILREEKYNEARMNPPALTRRGTIMKSKAQR